MDPQPLQPGPSRSKSSRLLGPSSNMALIGAQQERKQQLVHHDAANAATNNMSQHGHLTIICKNGSSTNRKQYAVACEFIHTVVNSHQLPIYYAVGIRWELRDQFIAARNGKQQWSTKAIDRTVCKTDNHEVVSSGMFRNIFCDKLPQEWINQAVITLEEATETYMVEVIAAFHCLKQQLNSCRYSICLLRWQGKDICKM